MGNSPSLNINGVNGRRGVFGSIGHQIPQSTPLRLALARLVAPDGGVAGELNLHFVAVTPIIDFVPTVNGRPGTMLSVRPAISGVFLQPRHASFKQETVTSAVSRPCGRSGDDKPLSTRRMRPGFAYPTRS